MKLLAAVGTLLCATLILVQGAPGINDHEEKIIGPGIAEMNQFPSVARLRVTRRDGSYKHCVGSLISNRYVLTAAFCLVNATVVQVRMGHPANMNSTFVTETTTFKAHSAFSISNKHNDIGIVDLEILAPISESVRPVPIAGFSLLSDNMVGRNATVAGWGYTSDQFPGMVETLRYVTLGIISNDECRAYLTTKVTVASICGMGVNAKHGICNGDEGAPLLLEDKDGQIIQIGIGSSWFFKCEDQAPSGFVRPHHYWQWISDYTGIPIRD